MPDDFCEDLRFLCDDSLVWVGRSGRLFTVRFSGKREWTLGGYTVSFVERQDDLICSYTDRTEDLWVRVLESDANPYSDIAAFVKQAEDTRKIIQFTHTVIQDPVPAPL